MMEVSVSEDTPEAARERAKMPMREGRDVNPARECQGAEKESVGRCSRGVRTVMGTLVVS